MKNGVAFKNKTIGEFEGNDSSPMKIKIGNLDGKNNDIAGVL
jgi:hypothetical protein